MFFNPKDGEKAEYPGSPFPVYTHPSQLRPYVFIQLEGETEPRVFLLQSAIRCSYHYVAADGTTALRRCEKWSLFVPDALTPLAHNGSHDMKLYCPEHEAHIRERVTHQFPSGPAKTPREPKQSSAEAKRILDSISDIDADLL